jgi:hypothetical protein
MDGVEGVCWIVNKGEPTELIISVPMWTALDAGVESVRRASILIKKSEGLVPAIEKDIPARTEMQ